MREKKGKMAMHGIACERQWSEGGDSEGRMKRDREWR